MTSTRRIEKNLGLSPYFRISYATSESELKEALQRISAACAGLAPDVRQAS
ncbi:hypothetical protein [Mesorhizobium sp. A556]